MGANQAWAQWGFHGGDCRFSPLALLNGGIRRAVWERKAWSQYQHTSPRQSAVLKGATGLNEAMADVSHSDFVASLNTPSDRNTTFGDLVDASRWLFLNALYPSIRRADGWTSDTGIMANQLLSSWTDTYFIDGQWLRDAGLVETDGSAYWPKSIRFLPHYEGYPMTRKYIDMWLYPSVSICPWMRVADTDNNTITASQSLLALSPNGWWICAEPSPGYPTRYKSFPLTANVPMNPTASGLYAPNVSLILDGRDWLKFQADTDD